MKKIILGLCCALFLVSCAVATKKLSSEDIGIRHIALEDEKDLNLADINYTREPAGESQKIERAFENAPPLIPHDISDFLPITKDDNLCLSCHLPDVAADSGATPIPASHFIDFRTKKMLDHLSDQRWNCTQCHVPVSDAKVPVKNNFRPEFRNKNGTHSSNLLDVLNEGI